MDYQFEKIHLYLSKAPSVDSDIFRQYVERNASFLAANPNIDPVKFPMIQKDKRVLDNPKLPKDLFFQLYEKFGGLNATCPYDRDSPLHVYNTSFSIEEILQYKDIVRWKWYEIQRHYPLTRNLVMANKELQQVHLFGNSSFSMSELIDMGFLRDSDIANEIYARYNKNCTWEYAQRVLDKDRLKYFMSNPNMTMEILRKNIKILIRSYIDTVHLESNPALMPRELLRFFPHYRIDSNDKIYPSEYREHMIGVCTSKNPNITLDLIKTYSSIGDHAYLCQNHMGLHNRLSPVE